MFEKRFCSPETKYDWCLEMEEHVKNKVQDVWHSVVRAREEHAAPSGLELSYTDYTGVDPNHKIVLPPNVAERIISEHNLRQNLNDDSVSYLRTRIQNAETLKDIFDMFETLTTAGIGWHPTRK